MGNSSEEASKGQIPRISIKVLNLFSSQPGRGSNNLSKAGISSDFCKSKELPLGFLWECGSIWQCLGATPSSVQGLFLVGNRSYFGGYSMLTPNSTQGIICRPKVVLRSSACKARHLSSCIFSLAFILGAWTEVQFNFALLSCLLVHIPRKHSS